MSPCPGDRHGERGSAYIIALLVLVVLTILGLALATISQTEVQIGANEVMSHRVLYGAEAGIQAALAHMLTVNSTVEATTVPEIEQLAFTLPEDRLTVDDAGLLGLINPAVSGVRYAERVRVAPFAAIRTAFCDMCPAGVGDVQLYNTNYATVSTAQRVSWTGNDDDPYDGVNDPAMIATHAQKQLYVNLGIQPWWEPRPEAAGGSAPGRSEHLGEIVQETHGGYTPPPSEEEDGTP